MQISCVKTDLCYISVYGCFDPFYPLGSAIIFFFVGIVWASTIFQLYELASRRLLTIEKKKNSIQDPPIIVCSHIKVIESRVN